MTDTHDTPAWSWPQGRAIVLYHWSWFDPAAGDVITGWSQRGVADQHGFVHFEAEDLRPARSLEARPDLDPIVEAHTFTLMTRLPGELRGPDNLPLPWIQALLGAK
jgi:hypothetical protein